MKFFQSLVLQLKVELNVFEEKFFCLLNLLIFYSSISLYCETFRGQFWEKVPLHKNVHNRGL